MPRRTVPLALYLRAREAARDAAVSPTPQLPKSPEGDEQECSRSFSESDLVLHSGKSLCCLLILLYYQ